MSAALTRRLHRVARTLGTPLLCLPKTKNCCSKRRVSMHWIVNQRAIFFFLDFDLSEGMAFRETLEL